MDFALSKPQIAKGTLPDKAAGADFIGRFREIISDPINLLIERHAMAVPLLSGAPHVLELDVVIAPDDQVQPPLPLASEGVRRWIWHSRYGTILIEVIGDDVFVNGQRVQPHAP